MNRAFKLLLAALLGTVALWLLKDTVVFALSPEDPESGRSRGCYTDVDYALGIKDADHSVRPIEFVVALATGGIAIWAFVKAVRRRSPA